VHKQVVLYEATDGREGGTLEDRRLVILTTVGSKTGNRRKNAKAGDREIPVIVLESTAASARSLVAEYTTAGKW
jgi:hypothetical protein